MDLRRAALHIAIFFLPVVMTSGQTVPVSDANQTGFPVFGTFNGSDHDLVSLQNGNLHIEIPIASFPQRHGQFAYKFIYDTPSYTLTYFKDPSGVYWSADIASGEVPSVNVGWRLTSPFGWTLDYVTEPLTTCPATGFGLQVTDQYTVIDPDGGKHPLALRAETGSGAPCNGSQLQGYALDGSGTFVDISSSPAKIVLKDGTQVGGAAYRDSNGNTASSSWDMLGRNNLVVNNNNAPSYTLWMVTDSNGNQQNFRLDWTSINVTSNFCPLRSGLTGGTASCSEYTASNLQVPSRLTLPDGLFYQFTWNSDGTLQQISLPTGGSIAYSYVSMRFNGVYSGGGCLKSDPNCVPTTTYPVRQVVTSRAVTNNGTTATWNYAGYPGGTTGSGLPPGATTVTDPLGNQQVHTFGCCSNTQSYETQVKYYQGSTSTGTLLRTVNTDYASDPSPLTQGAVINVRPIRETTILENGQTKKNETDYQTSTANCASGCLVTTYTFTWLNPTNVREYDWGSGTPGPLVRTTSYSYLHSANTNYLTANIADRPTSKTVYDGSGSQAAYTVFSYDSTALATDVTSAPSHDPAAGTSFTIRGNLTETDQWLNTTGVFLPTVSTYDILGHVRSIKDPNGNTTSFSYNDSWSGATCPYAGSNTYAYLTKTTNPKAQIAQSQYFLCTGLAQSHQDQNDINAGRAGTTFTYDRMNRPATTSFPDGGSITYDYSDNHTTAPPLSASSSTLMNASTGQSTTRISVLDGLGRIQQHKSSVPTAQCAGGYIYQDSTFDALGRSATTSNPYCTTSDSTYGLITNAYDALGRVTQTTKQDGSISTASYNGNCTTAADEAGKARKSCSDGLNRLTNVWEDPSGLNYETDYQYDTLANLVRIDQKGSAPSDSTQWRTRTFTYDSVSRLLTAHNPEAGTISYSYDANGNLVSRTDARGIITNYSPSDSPIDALNRVTKITYSDTTPTVYFLYDVPSGWGNPSFTQNNLVGRLSEVYATGTTTTGNQVFGYDAMGRVKVNNQCTPSNCGTGNYSISATYDLAGNLTALTYPSGRLVTFTYNSGNLLNQVQFAQWNGTAPSGGAYNYWSASDANFYPNGTPKTWTLGSGINESTMLNKRLQLQEEIVGNPAIYNFADHVYNYGTQNNGNVNSITDQLNSSRTQNFAYDTLNRLTSASESRWGLAFVDDAWGNRLQQNVTSGTAGQLQITVDGNNHIQGAPSNCTAANLYCYDAAGNLLHDNINHQYLYDAENRVTQVDGGTDTYTYAAGGSRVRKDISGSASTEYLYFKGNVIAERNVSTGDWSDYIYANGKRIARALALDNGLRIYGNKCPSCGSQYSLFYLQNAGGLANYTIRTGDKVDLTQYQTTGSHGGIVLVFTDGTNTNWNLKDQDGYYANDDGTQTTTHVRKMDLGGFVGKRIQAIALNQEVDTAAGAFAIIYEQVVLTSTDGTLTPIYTGQTTSPVSSISTTSGITGAGSQIDVNRNKAIYPSTTTTYYHSNQINSSTLITAGYGWPVWQATYLPYGEEYNSQMGDNHYRFTGQERDSETGLDYLGARHYGSTLGRFLAPDPLAGHTHNPQTLNRYGYVANNPLTLTDPTGLDFYLQCSEPSPTCQKTDDSRDNFVQGKWAQEPNGDWTFQPTVVTSASLQDTNGTTTATVSENGVEITTLEGTSQGIFIDNTPAADIHGSGKLSDFDFHVDGTCNDSCQSSGTWTFAGNLSDLSGSNGLNRVRGLLKDRGSWIIPFENMRAGLGFGAHPHSTQHRFGGSDCGFFSCPNSIHLSVEFDSGPSVYAPAVAGQEPKFNVPVTGQFHVDAHGDWFGHAKDVSK